MRTCCVSWTSSAPWDSRWLGRHHRYANQPNADLFRRRLTAMGITSYLHYPFRGTPTTSITSFRMRLRQERVHRDRTSARGGDGSRSGSGKMATCLSQLYHEHKRGVCAGYAKFETFPIWNLPLRHPVNLAYEPRPSTSTT